MTVALRAIDRPPGNGRGNWTERAREEAAGENPPLTVAVESTTAKDEKRNTTVKVEKTWKRVKRESVGASGVD